MAVLKALAEGADPRTGELLTQGGVLDRAEVREALAAAAAVLEKRGPQPGMVGKRWTAEEEARLVSAFEAGKAVKDIAVELDRKRGGVRSRLVLLGKLKPKAAGAPT
ncbi:MAG: hypothetical protein FD126_194 [Elusimicrobia bacterium]|nr:MAG: hypothetical protein FD126_194 [Elusimicrobiota bacterium]